MSLWSQGRPRKLHARHLCEPTLVLRHSDEMVPFAKDWEVNPIEVIPKSTFPNDRRNACFGEIEAQDEIGDVLRVIRAFGAL